MALLETIMENISTASQITADIAKRTAEAILLRDQIRRDRREIRKLTYEIGETYIRLHEEDFEEEYREFFEKIGAANSDIEVKLEKLAQLSIKPEAVEEVEDDLDEEEEWDELFEDVDGTVEKPAEEAISEEAAEEAEAAEETEAEAAEAEEAE